MARYRKRMTRSKSRKNFKKGTRTHRRNSMASVMRGGYRL